MKCSEIEPLVYLVREGELTPEERMELDSHLLVCENCRILYDSVLTMTTLVRQSEFSLADDLSGKVIADNIMQRIERSGNYRNSGIMMTFLKLAAAILLLIMVSAFALQEAGFQKSKSALRVRMHQTAMLTGSDAATSDCVNKLKRKLNTRKGTSFPGSDELTFNTVSEEQLTLYISQVCGPDAGNISAVKRMLKQAGLIKNSELN